MKGGVCVSEVPKPGPGGPVVCLALREANLIILKIDKIEVNK